jgi:hypothetical protein
VAALDCGSSMPSALAMSHLEEHRRLVDHDLMPGILLIEACEEAACFCLDLRTDLPEVIVLGALALGRGVREDAKLLLPSLKLLHCDDEGPPCDNVCPAWEEVFANDALEHRRLA